MKRAKSRNDPLFEAFRQPVQLRGLLALDMLTNDSCAEKSLGA